VVKKALLLRFDSLAATPWHPPKESWLYLSGYSSGFFGICASFRLNSQTARYGAFFTTLRLLSAPNHCDIWAGQSLFRGQVTYDTPISSY
jgi:hypothetical protein